MIRLSSILVLLAPLGAAASASAQDVPYERFQLDNGLTVVLHPDRTLPVAPDEMGDDAFFLPQFRLVGADRSAVIPEPTTALLVGFGLVALAMRRRLRA